MQIYCKSFYKDKDGVNKRLSFKLNQAGVGHLVEVVGVDETEASRAQRTVTSLLDKRDLECGPLTYRVDEANGKTYPKLVGYLKFANSSSATSVEMVD